MVLQFASFLALFSMPPITLETYSSLQESALFFIQYFVLENNRGGSLQGRIQSHHRGQLYTNIDLVGLFIQFWIYYLKKMCVEVGLRWKHSQRLHTVYRLRGTWMYPSRKSIEKSSRECKLACLIQQSGPREFSSKPVDSVAGFLVVMCRDAIVKSLFSRKRHRDFANDQDENHFG